MKHSQAIRRSESELCVLLVFIVGMIGVCTVILLILSQPSDKDLERWHEAQQCVNRAVDTSSTLSAAEYRQVLIICNAVGE